MVADSAVAGPLGALVAAEPTPAAVAVTSVVSAVVATAVADLAATSAVEAVVTPAAAVTAVAEATADGTKEQILFPNSEPQSLLLIRRGKLCGSYFLVSRCFTTRAKSSSVSTPMLS